MGSTDQLRLSWDACQQELLPCQRGNGFPTWLTQRKNAATKRRRETSCWQISAATDAAPRTATTDSTDLFGSRPPLMLCAEQQVEVVRNCWTLVTSIQTCLPCPVFSQPAETGHEPHQDTGHRGRQGGWPYAPGPSGDVLGEQWKRLNAQRCWLPLALGHRWRTASVRQHI